MKIALCQMAMHWTIAENLENIKNHLRQAAAGGAQLAVFPECAVTGYHRELPKITSRNTLGKAFDQLQAYVQEYRLPFIVGAPFIRSAAPDSVFNSALFFQPTHQNFELTSKIGLAEKEWRYFTPGRERMVFQMGKIRIGMAFCIEMNDTEALIADYKTAGLDILFWISYIAWGDPTRGEAKEIYDNSLVLSMALGVPVINVNWANAVNSTDIEGMGGSRVIRNGKIERMLAADEERIEIVEL